MCGRYLCSIACGGYMEMFFLFLGHTYSRRIINVQQYKYDRNVSTPSKNNRWPACHYINSKSCSCGGFPFLTHRIRIYFSHCHILLTPAQGSGEISTCFHGVTSVLWGWFLRWSIRHGKRVMITVNTRISIYDADIRSIYLIKCVWSFRF